MILPKVNRVSRHKLHPLSTTGLLVEALAAGKKEATSVAHIFINILSNFPCSFYLHESTKCPNSLGVLLFPICLNDAIFTFTFGISLFPSPPLPWLQNDCSSFAGAQQRCFPPCPFQVVLAPWGCLRSSSVASAVRERTLISSQTPS